MRRLRRRVMRTSRCRRHARTAAALLMTLACAATALTAQGRRRGGSPDQSAPSRQTVPPVLWEPDQIFPLAVAHASELKLTDEQRVQIETIASKLRASNAPLLTAIDTLKPEPLHLPEPGTPSTPTASPPPPTPEQIAAVVARRHALGDARAQLHENIRLARDQMTQLMTPDQQTRLATLENNARSAAERGDPGNSDGAHAGARVGRPNRGQNNDRF
jgi:hypothetical protein